MSSMLEKYCKIQNLALLFLGALLVGIVILVNSIFSIPKRKEDVLGDTASVNVSANVSACLLNFTLYPEKRIPSNGNWSNTIQLQIRNSVNTPLANVTFDTNALGNAFVNLCDNGIKLTPGTYNFSVAGLSHLRKNFNGVSAFYFYQTDFVRTEANDRLLAGETSVVYDNYINSLDISFLVATLYTDNLRSDLNRDNLVNSLDLSNQVYNIYKTGDI